jgi:hypothetical protein
MKIQMKREQMLEVLLDREEFTRLSTFFIEKAVIEAEREHADSLFAKYLRSGLDIITSESIKNVFQATRSPIETIFINSLLLSFIKADPLNLVVTSPSRDVPKMIQQFRSTHRNFSSFQKSYTEQFGNMSGVEDYLDSVVRDGRMQPWERAYFSKHLVYYHYLGLSGRFHLTPQAGLPEIRVDGKSIRVDMIFWVPDIESLKIVVECDGFAYHSNKTTFTTDRQRDRALKAAGYDVLRFSGSEINRNPIAVSSELFERLSGLQTSVAG